MKKIVKLHVSGADSLILLSAILALVIIPIALDAGSIWPRPLNVFYPENYLYQGHTATSPDGSYALLWSMVTEERDRQLCFQRFSATDQALNPQPVLMFGTQGKVPWRFTRASNGNYFIFARGYPESLLLLIDPDGNLLNEAATINLSITAESRVELVPDLFGGVWLSMQISRNAPRRISHYNATGEPAIPGFLDIPTNNNLFSDMSIIVQADNSAICAYNHRSNARILNLTSDVQVIRDSTFSLTNVPLIDSKVFQDSAGNLIWFAHTSESTNFHNILVVKTTDQGSILWEQSSCFSYTTYGRVKAWDATAFSDGTYTFAMITQPLLDSPNLMFYAQRINTAGGSLYYASNNQERALEPLDAQATLSLKLIPGIAGSSWAMISKHDPNDFVNKFSCLHMNPNGIHWSGEQIVHTEPWYSHFGEIGMGGFRRGNDLALIAQTHSENQSKILMSTISTTGAILSASAVAASKAAILDEHRIQPIGSNLFCAWTEGIMPHLWPQRKEVIRYQLVTSQGEKLLPQDAEIRSGGIPQDLNKLSSLSLPDGGLLLWWVENQSPSRIRAQHFDSNGSALWEEGGLLIATDDTFIFSSVLASHYQGDIYFAWDRDSQGEIRGQRLVNGIPQWETEGKLLIDSASTILPVSSGVKLRALDGNSLLYSCGESQGLDILHYTTLAMWRFDSSGYAVPGFEQGGKQVMRHYDGYNKYLEYIGLHPCPLGFIVSAYTWDGGYFPDDFDYNFYVTGTIHQLISPDGVCFWGSDGLGIPQQMLPLSADTDGYFAFMEASIVKRDYEHTELFREYLGAFASQAVETQPGVYIGIVDKRNYFSFTSQGELSLPEDAQFAQHYFPEPQICAQGDNAFFFWKEKTSYYSLYDYNAGLLLLQGFTRSSGSSFIEQDIPAPPHAITLNLAANPFKDQVNFHITCKQSAQGELSVYNIRGQKLKTLHKGDLQLGASIISWDGKDAAGKELSSGVYFVRLHSIGHKAIVKKMIKL
jgi:hypothetical protein